MFSTTNQPSGVPEKGALSTYRACVTGTVLRELLDHTFEIRIGGAKAPCEPVQIFDNNRVVRAEPTIFMA